MNFQSSTHPERWAHHGGPGLPNSAKDRTLPAQLLPLAREVAAACQSYESRQYECELAAEDASDDEAEYAVDRFLWSEAELQTELALALRVANALVPAQLAAMDAYCDFGLSEWVSACAFEAARRGQLQTALELFDTWDQLTPEEPAEQLGSRARLLLCGGQEEAARTAAQARLLREPENLDALEAAADIYRQCGDLDAAEKSARKLVAVARQRGDGMDLSCALMTLADVVHERGDLEEELALENEAMELSLFDEEDEDTDALWDQEDKSHKCPSCGQVHLQTAALPVVRSQPKVGRNQPCPCGSGAKYKKCCGR